MIAWLITFNLTLKKDKCVKFHVSSLILSKKGNFDTHSVMPADND